jgi:hypothetical protein
MLDISVSTPQSQIERLIIGMYLDISVSTLLGVSDSYEYNKEWTYPQSQIERLRETALLGQE